MEREPRPVLVGHDGSDRADAALRWAVTTAAEHGLPVDVVRVWDLDLGAFLTPAPPTAEDLTAVDKAALGAVEDAVERARAAVPGADATVRARTAQGHAARVLSEASAEAALLVVGRRGSGVLRQRLGSTAGALLRSARCPVAVVPAAEPAPPTAPVVVGWDGSAAARPALAWAAEHAAASGRPLTVLLGWQIMTLHGHVAHDPAVTPPLSAYEAEAAAEAAAGAALARELAAGRLPDGAVTARAVHRPAARALLEAAEDAAVLVVGSRGRGGFAGLVLGSTSDQVSRHAPCPVVVVRGGEDDVEDSA